MFNKDTFIKNCLSALNEADPALAVQQLMQEALADLAAVKKAFSGDNQPIVEFLYRSTQLTIAKMSTAPGSVSPIHNHRMWAVIGLFEGQEDNHLYNRVGNGIQESGIKSLRPGDIFNMDIELIHAIGNPLDGLNGALHVYGGDLQEKPGRSLWDPNSKQELAYDFDRLMAFTKQMNR